MWRMGLDALTNPLKKSAHYWTKTAREGRGTWFFPSFCWVFRYFGKRHGTSEWTWREGKENDRRGRGAKVLRDRMAYKGAKYDVSRR